MPQRDAVVSGTESALWDILGVWARGSLCPRKIQSHYVSISTIGASHTTHTRGGGRADCLSRSFLYRWFSKSGPWGSQRPLHDQGQTTSVVTLGHRVPLAVLTLTLMAQKPQHESVVRPGCCVSSPPRTCGRHQPGCTSKEYSVY